MELRQLYYFVKVARKQHVTHAAEEMHVAQSAVSRQIHQLEAELGVQLFVQKGRKLHLTPVGKLFLARVEEVLSHLESAVNEVRESQDPESGEIRLAFPHSLGVHLVPAVAGAFRRTHPKVRFRLKQGKFNSLINMVMDGEVDLALISPFPAGHEHVEGEVVLTEELYAIVPPHHPLAGCESLRLEQLKDETFVMFSDGYSMHTIVREACVASGFVPKTSFEGEETDTIRGLVAAGMGVSLLPDMALRHASSPLMPVKIRISEPKVTRTIGLIRRKGEKLPQVAERFRLFLIDQIGRI